ncbi:conserved fungal protein [Gigaspora margarita]|uniref:Conserved fungal protein n=1 Tax=Gigaspora margarita TaxID=4874 RepID=A0A8H4A292_GIGMA|nr:conserved fungal protein [Gigaspora margarita]
MNNFPNIEASGEDADNFVDSFEEFTEGTTEHNPDLDGSNDEFAEFEDATFEFAADLPEEQKSSGSTLNNLNFVSMDNSLTEALGQVLDNIFPVTNTTLLNKNSENKSSNKGLESVFITPKSLEIWKQISDESNEQPFQWKRSIIRKEFYSTLGITIEALEDTKPPVNLPSKPVRPTSTPNKTVTLSAPVSRSSTPDSIHNNLSSSHGNLPKQKISTTQIDATKQLDLNLARSLCSISEETLQTFTNVQLRRLKSELLSLSSQTSDALTFWLDQREQTIMDSETYNQMIECLVGHAQKIRDGGGIGGGNQAKTGWNSRGIKLKKKGGGTVASGLASLSLSFKKQKSQTNSPVTSTSDVFKNRTNGNSNDVYERPLSM